MCLFSLSFQKQKFYFTTDLKLQTIDRFFKDSFRVVFQILYHF